MSLDNLDPQESHIKALFQAYREACPDPEPDPHFTVRLWAGIDTRQSFNRDFGWFARGLATAAAALCLVLGVILIRQDPPVSFYTDTYLEVLATDEDSETETEIVQVAHGWPE